MRLAWIGIFALTLFFMAPSVMAMESWDLSSLLADFGHSFFGIESETRTERSLSRNKRSTAIQQYTVDIEISFPDPSLASLIKQLLMNNLSYPLVIDSYTNITGASITTACNQTGGNVQCSCEDGFSFPSAICNSYSQCGSNCNCITGTIVPSQYCQAKTVNINLSLKLLQDFTNDLHNPSSSQYIQLKQKLDDQFYSAYNSLSGFVSANVTGFRPGSVIADYTVVTEPATTTDLTTANSNLITNLQNSNISVSPTIVTIIPNYSNITVSPGTIFPNDTVNLVCVINITSYSNVSWYVNDTVNIGNTTNRMYTTVVTAGGLQSTLTISRAALTDSGNYTCRIDTLISSYPAETTLNVQPLQLTLLSPNVACDNIGVSVLQCCTQGGSPAFDLTCQYVSGSSNFIGTTNTISLCKSYTISTGSGCPLRGTSSLNCVCASSHGANMSQTVQVSYQGSHQANIITASDSISEGSSLTLQCDCNATSISSMSWNLMNNNIASSDTVSISTNLNSCQSILSILGSTLTVNWNGTYNCIVNNGALSASKVIHVYRLDKPSKITRSPITTGFKKDQSIPFSCCLNDISDYMATATLQIIGTSTTLSMPSSGNCYTASYTANTNSFTAVCVITNKINNSVTSDIMTLTYVPDPVCTIPYLGVIGSVISISCESTDSTLTGTINQTCQQINSVAQWVTTSSNCVLVVLNNLNNQVAALTNPGSQEQIPSVLQQLNNTVATAQANVSSSAQNIQLVIDILKKVNTIAAVVTENSMQNFLQTVNVVVANTAVWNNISNKVDESSSLLQSVETFSSKLNFNDTLQIKNNTNIQLYGSTIGAVQSMAAGYIAPFDFTQSNNLTGNVSISRTILSSLPNEARVISVAYATLKDILNTTQSSNNSRVLNGLVMTTTISMSSNISNFQIAMNFQKDNKKLNNASCVYWNFSKTDWDDYGCSGIVSDDFVTCDCNHLTSFSILMSANPTINSDQEKALTYITYIGLGISILSLVVCIIIELIVWKSVTKNKTSYMRHVCITNIAVTLLMADIWFIVGSAVSDIIRKETSTSTQATITQATNASCVAATFFTHFFYLCVFFWMLTMGLILFYRLMCVFHDLSKTTMMGISFFLGYGCPLIISVITVAVTQPFNTYLVGKFCWLNMNESKAFLAFVVPAFTILLINFITLFVVIVKVLRPSIGDKPKKEEKSSLNHIAKCILILTPLLGLTWGFGIGTIITSQTQSPSEFAIDVVFTILNSLQGFFILLFGCLMDKKVRDSLLNRFSLSRWSSQQTKTSNLSSTEPPFSKGVINLFGKRGLYNISSAQVSTSSELGSNSYSLLN